MRGEDRTELLVLSLADVPDEDGLGPVRLLHVAVDRAAVLVLDHLRQRRGEGCVGSARVRRGGVPINRRLRAMRPAQRGPRKPFCEGAARPPRAEPSGGGSDGEPVGCGAGQRVCVPPLRPFDHSCWRSSRSSFDSSTNSASAPRGASPRLAEYCDAMYTTAITHARRIRRHDVAAAISPSRCSPTPPCACAALPATRPRPPAGERAARLSDRPEGGRDSAVGRSAHGDDDARSGGRRAGDEQEDAAARKPKRIRRNSKTSVAVVHFVDPPPDHRWYRRHGTASSSSDRRSRTRRGRR